jgi:hypothetical protein
MGDYPIYYNGRYYRYSTVVSDYDKESYTTPEELVDKWPKFILQPFGQGCLEVTRKKSEVGIEYKEGELYSSTAGCHGIEDIELSNEEYERLLRCYYYKQAILARADNINDISYKVAKLPTGEMTPGTTVIEMKDGEISRVRKAYEK